MSDSDRGRGVLSPADRRYLRGEAEFETESSGRNARKRIRERTRQSIVDFTLLFEHLERRDRLGVLDEYPLDVVGMVELTDRLVKELV